MRYLPHTPDDISNMLSTIGAPSVDALFDSIPKDQQLGRPLNFGAGWTEPELQRELKKESRPSPSPQFSWRRCNAALRAGYRGSIVTAVRMVHRLHPYQPEMAQGTLQAIFEFQTLTADLYGCEIANASMYDGATAMMEAVLMAKRVKRKGTKVFVSSAVHPEYRQVLNTYLVSMDLEVIEVDFDASGLTSSESLQKQIETYGDDSLAFVYQTPNFLGQVESQKDLIATAKEKTSW